MQPLDMTPPEIIVAARASAELPEAVRTLVQSKVDEAGVDRNEAIRFNALKELYLSLRPSDRAFARWLLEQEMEAHRNSEGVSDSIILAVGILFELRQVEDALLIWQARNLTFDTSCAIPFGFVVGAGVDKTLNYWRTQSSREVVELTSELTEAAEAGELEEMADFRGEMKDYLTGLASG